jgi:hypothetical protein
MESGGVGKQGMTESTKVQTGAYIVVISGEPSLPWLQSV